MWVSWRSALQDPPLTHTKRATWAARGSFSSSVFRKIERHITNIISIAWKCGFRRWNQRFMSFSNTKAAFPGDQYELCYGSSYFSENRTTKTTSGSPCTFLGILDSDTYYLRASNTPAKKIQKCNIFWSFRYLDRFVKAVNFFDRILTRNRFQPYQTLSFFRTTI